MQFDGYITIFDHFLTLWHNKVFQAHLLLAFLDFESATFPKISDFFLVYTDI